MGNTMSYTGSVAKVMVSFPDDLLRQVDAEATRRGTSRSKLLQDAARHELGVLGRPREEVLAEMDAIAAAWTGPTDSAALVAAERDRRLDRLSRP